MVAGIGKTIPEIGAQFEFAQAGKIVVGCIGYGGIGFDGVEN